MTNYSQQYFTIESLESGNTITLTIGSSVTTSDVAWIAWSKDKTNWTTTNNVYNQTVTITVSADIENVYFKGSGNRLGVGTTLNDNNSQTVFSSTKTFNASGNIMSLLYSDNFAGQTTLTGYYTFDKLFFSSKIINSNNLVLPATTLSVSCYRAMFRNCTNLVSVPKLESITLIDSCYREMFYGCSSLAVVPELNTTILDVNCYSNMFRNCTSLTKSPVLPATTLKIASYANMFNGCTNLQEVTCLATDISATDCLTNWLNNVKATGTFYKHPSMTSWSSGVNGIPSGWTTEDYKAFMINGNIPETIKIVHNGVTCDIKYLKFGENLVWEYYGENPTPTYTPVTEIKMSNPQSAAWNTPYRNVWIDTGVVFPNNQDIWIEAEITKYQNYDDTIIGLCYDVQIAMGYNPGTNGRYAFRIFSPNSNMWLDATYDNGFYGNRVNNISVSNTTMKIEFGKKSNGKMGYIINGTQTSNEINVSTYDYTSLSASNHIFCCITAFGLRYVKIWSDYTKTTLLFNGIAAIDGNNTPCVYDSVSNSFKYFEYKNGYSDAGTVTYIS